MLAKARLAYEIAAHPINRTRPGSAVWRYLSWNIGRRLVDTSFVMPLADDVSIMLSNEENYATLAYTERLWDFEDMMFLVHLLRPGDLFVDIGANVGAYSLLASGVAGATSIAFEPVPRTYERLVANIRLNDLVELVEVHNAGLAEREGMLRFTSTLGGLNHVVEGATDRPTVEVPVRRLEDVLGERVPLIAKLDVEGYEKSVLAGAGDLLSAPGLTAIICELNGSGERYGVSDEELDGIIQSHGFCPFGYDPEVRLLKQRTAFRSAGLNTLYLRDGDSVRERLAVADRVKVGGRSF
ncbi:MAG: FkbM family methyltransferase [Geminicoccaceae bacterium]